MTVLSKTAHLSAYLFFVCAVLQDFDPIWWGIQTLDETMALRNIVSKLKTEFSKKLVLHHKSVTNDFF